MLRWRLLLGTVLIAAMVGLCWLDHLASLPGAWLLPLAIIFTVLASDEMLRLAQAGGMRPVAWPVYGGNLLLIAAGWIPLIDHGGAMDSLPVAAAGWPLAALGIAVLLVFAGELCRYERPGFPSVVRRAANLAAAVLAIVYVGGMLSLVVQARMVWGIAALAALVITVKMGDTGAFAVGRLIGRHKMAPVLSPGKTIEGAVGGLTFACVGAWATFRWLVPLLRPEGEFAGHRWEWVLFGVLVGAAGLLGDLAESLLKRDVGRKDSSSWMPGFGGVLDMLDSILLAAPVAWLCWATGLVGR